MYKGKEIIFQMWMPRRRPNVKAYEKKINLGKETTLLLFHPVIWIRETNSDEEGKRKHMLIIIYPLPFQEKQKKKDRLRLFYTTAVLCVQQRLVLLILCTIYHVVRKLQKKKIKVGDIEQTAQVIMSRQAVGKGRKQEKIKFTDGDIDRQRNAVSPA